MKMILSFLVIAAAFASEANAMGIASQIEAIHCDNGGSQTYYYLKSKKIIHEGRTETDVKPMVALKINEQTETITVTSMFLGKEFKEVFTVVGEPYTPGLDPNDIFVLVKKNNTECTGRIK